MGHYKSNVRDQVFNLFEVFGLEKTLGEGPFSDLDVETATEMLGELARLMNHRFGPKTKKPGELIQTGLWRYSRHPNYFFEWLGWWAWVLAAVGSPLFLLSLSGPLFMLVFLFKITGIPATEEQALRSRGDDYRRYQRTTSMFVPWFPKKGDTAWSSR